MLLNLRDIARLAHRPRGDQAPQTLLKRRKCKKFEFFFKDAFNYTLLLADTRSSSEHDTDGCHLELIVFRHI
jgi:hypothetical protein